MEQDINKPLVSVIVPCYNHQDYIKECIESIVQQTYENIELIVIDDGSKDSSPQILEELALKYNFTFIQQQNAGIAKTLNTAITKYTKGKYISICASDDFYTKNRIELQVAFMQQHPQFALCYGNVNEIDNNSKIVRLIYSSTLSGNLYEEYLFKNLNIPTLSCFYKKDALLSVGLFDETAKVEDTYMFIKILKQFKAGYLNEILGNYRRHEHNFSGTRIVEMYKENMMMIDKLFKTDIYYDKMIKNSRLIWFYQLSKVDKNEAITLLTKIPPKKYFSKYFFGGIINLLKIK